MIFGPKEIKDRNGRTVILRNAEVSDSEDLIAYLKVTSSETPFLIREPDEVTLSLEQESTFIKARKEDPRELMLIATLDGRHIGNCSLMSIASYRRYSHRCAVAIALYQEYCNCGIGKIMLQTVLDAAKDVGYEQAELEVISDNDKAISLYEKLGFKKYGHFPDNMKYLNGKYADADWMMKKLYIREDLSDEKSSDLYFDSQF